MLIIALMTVGAAAVAAKIDFPCRVQTRRDCLHERPLSGPILHLGDDLLFCVLAHVWPLGK